MTETEGFMFIRRVLKKEKTLKVLKEIVGGHNIFNENGIFKKINTCKWLS